MNDCGVNATAEYFDNMHSQLDEMIRNLLQSSPLSSSGELWNEVSTLGDAKLQGKFDADRVVAETQRLYNHAKSLDPLRYVGLTDCTVFGSAQYQQLAGDYFSENRYPDWYQMGGKDRLTKEMKAVHERMGKANIAEYGGGCNPFCHTTDSTVMKDRNNDSRHYEEYACYLHESAVRQILKMPWLNFTSLWIMFDFPVAARHEGYIDSDDGIHFTENNARLYMNDKGLVTRDRQTKKDPFYLYKSLWNHKVTTVYITGRRRKGQPQGQECHRKGVQQRQGPHALSERREGAASGSMPQRDRRNMDVLSAEIQDRPRHIPRGRRQRQQRRGELERTVDEDQTNGHDKQYPI